MDGSYFSSMFSTQTTQAEAIAFIKTYRSMYGIPPDKAAAMAQGPRPKVARIRSVLMVHMELNPEGN